MISMAKWTQTGGRASRRRRGGERARGSSRAPAGLHGEMGAGGTHDPRFVAGTKKIIVALRCQCVPLRHREGENT